MFTFDYLPSGAFAPEFFSLFSGTNHTIQRFPGEKARRLNSSLRGHRAAGCRIPAECSGPKKTLFASTGPNSLLRSHRHTSSSVVIRYCDDPKPGKRYVPGWMKPGRGHQFDNVPLANDFILNINSLHKYSSQPPIHHEPATN